MTDLFEDAVGVTQDEMVGQTKDDKPRGRKPGIAAAVTQGFGEMRGTLCFDDEACLLAEEIDDEGADGMLSAKFGPHHLPVA